MKRLVINAIYFFTSILLLTSCKKYLDAKPDKKLSTPSSIEDLQAILDFSSLMNQSVANLGEVSADNYFLKDADLNSLGAPERDAYFWSNDIYTPGNFPNVWSNTYDPVYNSNVVLENITKIERTDQNKLAWDNVKGSAFCFRAKSFLKAVWTWAKAYDKNTSSNDLGIPLRVTSDFNQKTTRATVEESYNRILSDLKEAVALLPVSPIHVMRPSKPAAYALLARTYLSMRQYDSCYKYSDLCLQLYSTLVDYNGYPTTGSSAFQRFNPEVIMHSNMQLQYAHTSRSIAKIDSNLYNSYDVNDARKAVFFRANSDGTHFFSGDYNGANPFDGIATDEVLLMRAECNARLGNKDAALTDLNTLMVKRWKNNGTWIPFAANDSQQALNVILTERRKELIFRDLRWMDIKRLNKENANITLKRVVNGQQYMLAPNDKKFALPIPPDIVNLTGIQQN
jgi:hypothetical protein